MTKSRESVRIKTIVLDLHGIIVDPKRVAFFYLKLETTGVEIQNMETIC